MNEQLIPEEMQYEAYMANVGGDNLSKTHASLSDEGLGGEIEKIIAHQFDLVTNLRQEAYLDSLSFCVKQISALFHQHYLSKVDGLKPLSPVENQRIRLQWQNEQPVDDKGEEFASVLGDLILRTSVATVDSIKNQLKGEE